MYVPVQAATVITSEWLAAGAGVWCSVAGCASHAAAVRLVTGVWVGVLSVVAAASLTYLPCARRAVGIERDRTRAERDAFERFEKRVARLDPDPSPEPPGGAAPTGGVLTKRRPDPGTPALDQVAEHYRETVLAVGHYEEEYDEPLATNMAAEFGEDVATAVTDGSAFTPDLQQALVAGAREARRERGALLDALDEEADALAAAADRLESVVADLEAVGRPSLGDTFADLFDDWTVLEELEAACEAIHSRRQASLHDDRPLPGTDGVAFHEYLYYDLPVTHPVLAEVGALSDRVAERKRAVSRGLARRV